MRAGLLVVAALAIGCGREQGDRPLAPSIDIDANLGCGLVTCASAQATCGPVGDGCGGTVDCGSCLAPQVCGGDGASFTCGAGCVPRTCADAGATCGRVADGCGGLTPSCGTCGAGLECGGAGVANTCGVPPCVGLCLQQDACPSQPATTIRGTVTAPGHADTAVWGAPDPIYGALVYVPNGAAGPPSYGVTAFPAGVACDSCRSLVTGTPLVTATTGVDGTFTLTDAPCGVQIPLVIQLGRWRRQITIPSVACCATTTLTAAQTHLPRSRVGEPGDLRSDIPRIAVSTGQVDALHCVLRKLGVDDREFTNPTGNGRVHLYKDNGAQIDTSTPAASTLYSQPAQLAKYDMALFECVGTRVPKTPVEQQHVIDFANAGGRVFATHFSYVWLTNSDGSGGTNTGPKPFSQTAAWLVDQAQVDAVTAQVDQTLQGDPDAQARRVAFASWLLRVGASATVGQIPVNAARHDLDAITSTPGTAAGTPAQRWLYSTDPGLVGPLQYTFDTPIAYAPSPRPTKQCGRVMYSDFHVSDALAGDLPFPSECTDGPLTPQEKTLEFLLFDLASCIGPPPSACVPKTCADLGLTCGFSGDGCDDGVVLSCGSCSNGRTCGGGGPGVCGTGLCVPHTCAEVGATCGTIGDGCGGTVDCGTCPVGQNCGGGDVANVCGQIIL